MKNNLLISFFFSYSIPPCSDRLRGIIVGALIRRIDGYAPLYSDYSRFSIGCSAFFQLTRATICFKILPHWNYNSLEILILFKEWKTAQNSMKNFTVIKFIWKYVIFHSIVTVVFSTTDTSEVLNSFENRLKVREFTISYSARVRDSGAGSLMWMLGWNMIHFLSFERRQYI